MKFKKTLGILITTAIMLSMVACNKGDKATSEATSNANTASTKESELEAMKKEPAYGKPIKYWLSDGCTSGPVVADKLGYYKEAGLKAEGVKGTSYTEALGTGATDVAVGHIATMLVPATNGVNLTFVGGAHVGCKSIYVLNDSKYKKTADMKGTKIAVPNGIGASDYNITALLLNADGVNPLKDVELTQVETSACIAAMERNEISGALLSDTFAYDMLKKGKLRMVRSLTYDKDFQTQPCCIIAMNATYVKENPIHAKLITSCVKKAHEWMRNNPEEATQMLLDEGLNSGSLEKNVELNKSLKFGLTDEFTEAGLRKIAKEYIKLDLITSTDNIEDVMSKAWNPQAPEK
ncbi:ABC transporter substrate-binding protein [Clostridium sporogenes]|jgi:NitT/TauT family transport system substrate-binding protein|uniref:ABC transporter substrate-binding protein n=1 Tax=unclassified Clostridium TaxID=2614128 RepID=UPI0013D27A2A|nr:ABC transporter substrate-binding protein [Clostridium sporogenes]NFS26308.1 ABC transporter substrate-binding protein [Clostridium sporogenes]